MSPAHDHLLVLDAHFFLALPTVLLDDVAVLLGTVIFIASLLVRYFNSPWRRLPPGPSGYPLIGNALELREKQWLTFTRWRETYGDVVYFHIFGQPAVVLNSQKAASDLLERRATIYSDRVRNIVGADVMCGGLVLLFQNYTPFWRRLRKAAHEGLTSNGVKNHLQQTQRREALMLSLSCLQENNDWQHHVRRTTTSAVMTTLYNTPPMVSRENPYTKTLDAIDALVARFDHSTMPRPYLVEVFPWMKHIPSRFARWKREAEEWFRRDSAILEALFNEAKADDHLSVSATLLDNSLRNGLSVRENSWLAGTLYVAGVDTTSAALSWAMQALLTYPETQQQAQAELDCVVGRLRVPTFADIPRLPYLRAMVRELLRWRPVSPVGLPHLSTQDDWYEGMFIPARTICIANVWGMNHDPAVYGADAEHFNPARFLDANGELVPPAPETKGDGHSAFGFGRRICPGKQVANDSLMITLAVMMWACTIERRKDVRGDLTPIDLDGCDLRGVAICPIPFQCKITPRFPEASLLLEQERELHVT
ncbi:cytochrome P450 [Artomyces pyxidatus]|uniref:Cytochrome P450 n=1 Tax=Artomyces pyxidatus TaxID=48021 RepID=A0ACB8TAE9_9AGAM|nr:cytochrome P450 [Artomyces pyxidatus]